MTLGIAFAGAVGTANASATTTHHRIHTVLAISAAKHVKAKNTTINGDLRSNGVKLPGRVVWLERTNDQGKFVALRSKVTDRLGAVHFTVAPLVKRRFKLVFGGSHVFAPSQSPVVIVHPVA